MDDVEWEDMGGASPEFADDDVTLIREAAGGVTLVPKSLHGLEPEERSAVTDLLRTAGQIHQLQERAAELVEDLRDAGLPWAAVGWCTGMSGEGARRRWGG